MSRSLVAQPLLSHAHDLRKSHVGPIFVGGCRVVRKSFLSR